MASADHSTSRQGLPNLPFTPHHGWLGHWGNPARSLFKQCSEQQASAVQTVLKPAAHRCTCSTVEHRSGAQHLTGQVWSWPGIGCLSCRNKRASEISGHVRIRNLSS
eukprot:3539501-Amphidinium_carterae.1